MNNDITQGHAKALNQAIHVSNSKYVAVLDDDDNWDNAAKLQITKDESYYPVVAPATLEIW